MEILQESKCAITLLKGSASRRHGTFRKYVYAVSDASNLSLTNLIKIEGILGDLLSCLVFKPEYGATSVPITWSNCFKVVIETVFYKFILIISFNFFIW